MKVQYFPETDTLYIEFRDRDIVQSKDLDENTVLDLDAEGNVCAITFEHASDRTDVHRLTVEESRHNPEPPPPTWLAFVEPPSPPQPLTTVAPPTRGEGYYPAPVWRASHSRKGEREIKASLWRQGIWRIMRVPHDSLLRGRIPI